MILANSLEGIEPIQGDNSFDTSMMPSDLNRTTVTINEEQASYLQQNNKLMKQILSKIEEQEDRMNTSSSVLLNPLDMSAFTNRPPTKEKKAMDMLSFFARKVTKLVKETKENGQTMIPVSKIETILKIMDDDQLKNRVDLLVTKLDDFKRVSDHIAQCLEDPRELYLKKVDEIREKVIKDTREEIMREDAGPFINKKIEKLMRVKQELSREVEELEKKQRKYTDLDLVTAKYKKLKRNYSKVVGQTNFE